MRKDYVGNCVLTKQRNYLFIDAAFAFVNEKLVIPLQKPEKGKIRIFLDCILSGGRIFNDTGEEDRKRKL